MSLLVDISSLITSEINKFIGDMPDYPDNLICLYRTGGRESDIDQSLNVIDKPTFQVMVRDSSYAAGELRCEQIKSALNGIRNTTVNNTFYIEILQQSDILGLGKDDKNRSLFSVNFKTQIVK